MQRAIVQGAQQGDEETFVALVRELGDTCMAIAYRILRDVDLAEDAVQISIVTAWRQLRALRDPDRFESWLYRLLVRTCYNEANAPDTTVWRSCRSGPRWHPRGMTP
jgi:RNA polymerase sigma-70 factor, ECF subfamily